MECRPAPVSQSRHRLDAGNRLKGLALVYMEWGGGGDFLVSKTLSRWLGNDERCRVLKINMTIQSYFGRFLLIAVWDVQ